MALGTSLMEIIATILQNNTTDLLSDVPVLLSSIPYPCRAIGNSSPMQSTQITIITQWLKCSKTHYCKRRLGIVTPFTLHAKDAVCDSNTLSLQTKFGSGNSLQDGLSSANFRSVAQSLLSLSTGYGIRPTLRRLTAVAIYTKVLFNVPQRDFPTFLFSTCAACKCTDIVDPHRPVIGKTILPPIV